MRAIDPTERERCVQAYVKYGKLKHIAKSCGLPWQLVYCHLRDAGIDSPALTADFTARAASTYRTDTPKVG